jgi:two-component system, OmpR family, sensor histidine kinase CiaH
MTVTDENKKRLRLTTIVYWVLLTYIIAALIWWFISLYNHNESMYHLRLTNLHNTLPPTSPEFTREFDRIKDIRQRNVTKYVGEGAAFFILLVIGAVYLYRSVRQQFRAQQQQQNFVMAITHELKTPISVARLNLETLQRHKLEDSRKEKLLNMTLQETLRLDGLINNILISSQLDGHSYHIAKEELNFSDLVKDVTQQFTYRYSDRRVLQAVDEDIDLHGDPLLLKLLVSNLLENANKYSPKDKAILVELSEKNNTIQLNVKDEGCGIEDREKKNVFEKFYRIGNEQTRTAKGTGLGLYLCKKIVEDHHGDIHIENNQPQGSNFVVRFFS